jgi:lysosomal alpha-mannosidase
MDDPKLEDFNVEEKVNAFIEYVNNQQNSYKTKNLILTIGDDFQYSNAHMNFKNLDKLIKYVNERQLTNGSNVNVFYSTTACYLYSLNRENTTWSVKSDDFFPYAHRGHSFWTGYFTSRPTLKYYTKQASNVLQAARKVGMLYSFQDPDNFESLKELERAQGVLQHHDAVAGTERQHVAKDYAKRLYNGIEKGIDFMYNAFGQHSSENEESVIKSTIQLNFSFLL